MIITSNLGEQWISYKSWFTWDILKIFKFKNRTLFQHFLASADNLNFVSCLLLLMNKLLCSMPLFVLLYCSYLFTFKKFSSLFDLPSCAFYLVNERNHWFLVKQTGCTLSILFYELIFVIATTLVSARKLYRNNTYIFVDELPASWDFSSSHGIQLGSYPQLWHPHETRNTETMEISVFTWRPVPGEGHIHDHEWHPTEQPINFSVGTLKMIPHDYVGLHLRGWKTGFAARCPANVQDNDFAREGMHVVRLCGIY